MPSVKGMTMNGRDKLKADAGQKVGTAIKQYCTGEQPNEVMKNMLNGIDAGFANEVLDIQLNFGNRKLNKFELFCFFTQELAKSNSGVFCRYNVGQK